MLYDSNLVIFCICCYKLYSRTFTLQVNTSPDPRHICWRAAEDAWRWTQRALSASKFLTLCLLCRHLTTVKDLGKPKTDQIEIIESHTYKHELQKIIVTVIVEIRHKKANRNLFLLARNSNFFTKGKESKSYCIIDIALSDERSVFPCHNLSTN